MNTINTFLPVSLGNPKKDVPKRHKSQESQNERAKIAKTLKLQTLTKSKVNC